jgi:repressor LexA
METAFGLDELNMREQELFAFLQRFTQTHHYSPTVADICKRMGYKSTATGQLHLTRLEEKGYIRRKGAKHHNIEIVSRNAHASQEVPRLGRAPAGPPFEAVESVEDSFSLPPDLFRVNGDLYMLTVVGESMINDGIYDGDLLVIRRQDHAENGEIVVAMIETSATIKRFYREADGIRLQPANDNMKAYFVPSVRILGIAVGIVRRFR